MRALTFLIPTLLAASAAGPLLLAVPAANAEPSDILAPPASENGRYSMTPSGSGFLRLDTRTGAVSLCTVNGGNAECRAAADDRAALESEIDRLAKRNAELETRTVPTPRGGSRLLPDDQEAQRALDFAEQFMRRMMRIMRDEPKNPT
jgi:hypothetical protein